ncbi:MAG: ABC transporter permease [candidate division Zixibacteria bacterium]|nr:ABC transporter permease [candidate division Zixibacteria bacterium]
MSKLFRFTTGTREGVKIAIDSLRANKFRSFMTILGVMIGVGAVILVNTIMDGFSTYAEASIDKIGSNIMYINKWAEDTDFDNLTDKERRRKNITITEATAIREMCPLVKAVSPEKRTYDNVAKYGNRLIRNPDDFRGCWPEQIIVTNREISHGRFIDENDMRRTTMVCVIGPEVADALFDTRPQAIGKQIRVNGHMLTVIGVQEEVKDLFGISENDFIYIPMTTFDKLYPNIRRVYLLVSAVSREKFDEAKNQVINALRRVRQVRADEPNNFGILTQDIFKDHVGSITANVHLGAIAVASVGLLVGVIGVMNIMLIAVTQRTREIGLRKAIGARRSSIIFQFLIEAGTLTGIGGIVGVTFGALAGFIITSVLEWQYFLSPVWTIIAVVVSVTVGMVAGIYPALRASKVDPVVALGHE